MDDNNLSNILGTAERFIQFLHQTPGCWPLSNIGGAELSPCFYQRDELFLQNGWGSCDRLFLTLQSCSRGAAWSLPRHDTDEGTCATVCMPSTAFDMGVSFLFSAWMSCIVIGELHKCSLNKITSSGVLVSGGTMASGSISISMREGVFEFDAVFICRE